jgi:hypothetical protein
MWPAMTRRGFRRAGGGLPPATALSGNRLGYDAGHIEVTARIRW